MSKNLRFLVVLSASALLAGCGGSSSSVTPSSESQSTPTSEGDSSQITSAAPSSTEVGPGSSESTPDSSSSEKEFPDYQIIFDSMGGSYVAPITVEWGLTALNLKPADPVREGYVFDAWCWDKDYLVTPYDWSLKVTSDIYLYARWTEEKIISSEESSSVEPVDELVEYWIVGDNGTDSNTFSVPWKISGGIQMHKDNKDGNLGILESQYFGVGDEFKAVNKKDNGEEQGWWGGADGGNKQGWTIVTSGMGAGNVKITIAGNYKVYLSSSYTLWLDPVE